MLLGPYDYYKLYDELLEDQRNTEERNLLIFAATATCDALCATKILMAILKQDALPHSVIPVCDYEDLQAQFETHLSGAQDKRTVILVGLGANEDMPSMLRLDEEPYDKVKLIIIDCHRPLMHKYCRQDDGHRLVVVVDDADYTLQDMPDPGLDAELSDEQGSDSGTAAANQSRKRKREEHEAHVEQHYQQGFHCGKPAACLALDFARELRKDQALHYWWSIMGFTEQYMHYMMKEDMYLRLVNEMKAYINAQGLNDMPRHDEDWDGDNSVLVNIPLYDQIEEFDELRLPMMVQWTLWDTLLNAPYPGSRLQTYTEKGKDTIKLLLLSMGITLESAHTTWSALSYAVQRRVLEKLTTVGPRFKLAQLIFPSFRWLKGYDAWGLPAVDAVLAVNALVETGGRLSNLDSSVDAKRKNFMDLLQALGTDSKANLKRGIDAAKVVQRVVLQDGGSMVLRYNMVHIKRNFLVFDLLEQQLPHKLFQSSPNTLVKLGLFLQDAYQHRAKGTVVNIILVGPKFMEGENESCLLVGLTARNQTRRKGNMLGEAFQAAAEKNGISATIQAFDNRVVKVAASKSKVLYEEAAYMCMEYGLL